MTVKSQRRTKAPYTRESIERALTHHEQRGSVEYFTAPTGGSNRWSVAVLGYATVLLSDAEAHAFCVGLAAADRAAEGRVLRQDGKRLGPILLRWTDQRALRTIAAGGGPITVFDDLQVYCPLCRCNKSGHKSEPNQIVDSCSDSRCLCHDDDWET